MKPSVFSFSTSGLFQSIVFITILCITPAYGQHWQSGIKATGSDQTYAMYQDADIAVDGAGNMFIAGHFESLLSFDSLLIQSDDDQYYSDIFVCRINANHEVQWLKRIDAGSNYGDYIAIALDDSNNVYVTGDQSGRMFVSKYDDMGTLLWSKTFGTDVWGYGTVVKTDIYDNVYVSGGSGWNFFMAKLNSSGDILWIKDIWVNFSAGCMVSDIALDVFGNIYFAGKFEIDLPLDHITLPYTGSWGPSVFWGKMSSEGKFIWAKSAAGRASEQVSLELTSDNHLLLSGGVSGGSVTFGSKTVWRGNCCQGATGYMVKTDTTGNVLWAKASTDNYYGSMPNDMQVDWAGNIYLMGSYFTCYGTYCSESDYYIEKYDPDGTPLWRKDYASPDSEGAKGIDIDNNGLLYLLGVNSSKTFVDEDMWIPTRTFGIGVFNTDSSTYKRTPRPFVEPSLTWLCDPGDTAHLSAAGQQLRWYGSLPLSSKLAEGDTYNPVVTKSGTYYVTQTVGGIESWPAPAVVRLPGFIQGDLIAVADSIVAPRGDEVTYQWLHNGDSIANANDYYILVPSHEYDNYSVVLSQGPCKKTLDHIIMAAEPVQDNEVVFYPNPASNFITMINPGSVSGVRVIDIRGNEVSNAAFLPTEEIIIDLSQQQPGLFIIEVTGKGIHKYSKVIKR